MKREDSDRYTMNIAAASTTQASVWLHSSQWLPQSMLMHPLPPPQSFKRRMQQLTRQQRRLIWSIQFLLSPPAVVVSPVVMV